MTSRHSQGRLDISRSIFLLCDMQDGMRPYTWSFTEVVMVAKSMVTAAGLLRIPLIVTEHQGYGSTVTDIDVSRAKVFSKELFSMMTPEVEEEMKNNPDRKSVVLFGIQTDCCVRHTTLDLLNTGYEVYIIADACSTTGQASRQFAIKNLRQAGAVIMSSTATLYELIKATNHPRFDEINKLAEDARLYSDQLLRDL